MNQQTMELNKETAIRLWEKAYGKATKAQDYTGRTMAKAAYNDRNSTYAWNVDHIKPVSRGGKTAEHNLVICHMLTNDEKADSFPCFNANNKHYEIIKVQNHYEIKEKDVTLSIDAIDVFDGHQSIQYFNQLEELYYNEENSTNTIVILFEHLNHDHTHLIHFLKDISGYNLSFISYSPDCISQLTLSDFNTTGEDDEIQEALDKSILLYTYLKYYFKKYNYFRNFQICLTNGGFDAFENYNSYTKSPYINNDNYIFNCLNSNKLLRNTIFVEDWIAKRLEIDGDYVEYAHSDFVEVATYYKDLKHMLEKE